MQTYKIILLSLLLSLTFPLKAQNLQNVNPDPDGPPWLVGGLRVLSESEISKIPVIELSQDDLQRYPTTLPDVLDNTNQPFFRPVFNQADGSCAQSSGVAYNFTYEINRERNTSAISLQNRFPSHYTYNFLNQGDGNNGSWYVDGWDIIQANGCPNLPTYGNSLDALGNQGWMSGYDKYESAMHNRVKEYFAIDVSTPNGLLTLKHWLYDHLENATTGGLVNFAAGIANTGYNITYSNIITSWGFPSNHAMTFAGWNDNISYDYNGDGQITNNIDINNDGVVDMRDWEKGALIMVNTWGNTWGNNGRAYVMYKTLAESLYNGGIVGNKVFGLRVKNDQNPQLIMRVKMTHNSRNMIKISAGISTDVNSNTPQYTMDFPLFNYQGGPYPMKGNNDNSPIKFSLDISPLLDYIDPDTNAKYFLIVNEDDPNGNGSGNIVDYAIVDNNQQIFTCNQHNVSINNNSDTVLSLTASINFNAPVIATATLPVAAPGQAYSHTLTAQNGSPDYEWHLVKNYQEQNDAATFPAITSNPINVNDNDDGFGSQQLPFDFPFFGEYYNQIYVLTDGSIVFEPGFDYLRTEQAIKSHKIISVFASDLKIFSGTGQGIFYEGDATHATIRWKTALYGNDTANIDVAVTLYPDGNIRFYYGNNITPGLDWASGISDGDDNYLITSLSRNANPSNNVINLQPEPFPNGMFISTDGIFQGTAPNTVDTWPVTFKVTDNNNISKTKTLTFETNTSGIAQNNQFKISCYPNPADKYVIFDYLLKSDKKITIEIYNLQGKKLVKILDKKQTKGHHEIIWYPHLPRGIYLYKLRKGSLIAKGKIIIK